MSEYQYYEWQTIDRPLTAAQQREVNGLSSHMDTVTSTQAVVTYSWGDFKHDPKQVLLQYFDAFLYDSNFGSRELMFRLPQELVDAEAIRVYCLEYHIEFEAHGPYFVLAISGENDDGYEMVEADNILDELIPLREQLLQGDYRMLYILWLKAAESDDEIDEDEFGPPIPPGLDKLDASLQTLIEFFDVNPHLVAAAAASGPKAGAAPEPDLEAAVAKLTRAEADRHLLALVHDEPGALLQLKKRLLELSGGRSGAGSPSTRSIADLIEHADHIEREAQRQARTEAERKRIEKLEKLAQNEEATWAKVETLLNQKGSNAYTDATQLLVELKELAQFKKWEARFQDRLSHIRANYGKSTALMDRFRRAGLI